MSAADDRLVSVVIPVYNGAKTIEETVQSVLDQSYPHIEIIVVDDGSTDNSVDLVQRMGAQIRILTQTNQGCAAACTAGMRLARGAFIQILGADDLLYSKKLERQFHIFSQQPDADVVFCDLEKFSNDPLDVRRFKRPKRRDRRLRRRRNLLPVLLKRNVISAVTPLVRAEWYRRVEYYDVRLTNLEDWNAFLHMAHLGARFVFHDEVLAGVRRHASNKSDRSIPMNRARMDVVTHFFNAYGASYSKRTKRMALAFCHLENARLYRADKHAVLFLDSYRQAVRIRPFLAVRHPAFAWKAIRSLVAHKRQIEPVTERTADS